MKTLKIQLALTILLFAGNLRAQTTTADYGSVIPQPALLEEPAGEAPFVLDGRTCIHPGAGLAREAEFLREYILEMCGIEVPIVKRSPKRRVIELRISSQITGREAYAVEIDAERVVISGATSAGVFYGIQTLRKSLPVADCTQVLLPAAAIGSTPRFGYRGAMLDVSRHFFDVEFVKEFIDMLALHNINRFHWHLTDDQGWRIEIASYPRLTEIGSYRPQTIVGRHGEGGYDRIPHTGYYTREQAAEIVRYAAERHIDVIPEIDMPGHMVAALAAYPELGCTGGPYAVRTRWEIADEVLCVGQQRTLDFVKGVLDEILEIFPSEWIHIGGDECPKQFWKECPHCQRKITELGFDREENPEERLQGWFMREVSNYLGSRGRHIIGWDEILEGDCVGPHDIIMSWRGDKGGITAAGKHIRTIMASEKVLYFDRYQTPGRQQVEPLGFGGCNTLERVYAYDPLASIPAGLEKYVLGCQGSLWTEYVATENHAMHMFLPRAAALAEIQWADPATKDYEAFLRRLPRLLEIYRLYGWTYAPYVLEEIRTLTPENHKTTDKP